MACNSLKGLAILCGETMAGGASEIYVIAYKDLMKLVGTNEVYAKDPISGLISEIGVNGGGQFVQIGIYPKASNGFTSNVAKDDAVGFFYFNQTVGFQLRGLTKENADFIKDAGTQPVVFIIKDRMGKYTISGLGGMLTMETAEGGMGMVIDDGQSINITFSGMENDYASFLDSTLLPELLVKVCPLVTITSQPDDVVTTDGSSVSFDIITAGGLDTSYQWYSQAGIADPWIPISGATSSTYTFSASTAFSGYRYKVEVKNGGIDCRPFELTSRIASLEVNP